MYALLNISRVAKSKSMKQMEHVACMGKNRNAYIILVVKPEGKIHGMVGCGLDWSGSGREQLTGGYEHSNELPGSIKY